jgi:CRP-like cAMP-binding protein
LNFETVIRKGYVKRVVWSINVLASKTKVAQVKFRNFLLSALNDADRQALMPDLVEVSLAQGQVLFEVGDEAESVYFPSSAVVSVVTVMEDGRSVESHTIGRESGVALVNAAGKVPVQTRIFAQVGGAALRLASASLRRQLAASPTLAGHLMRHVHATLLQAQQFTACNVLHSADQRLARWILMTADRTGSASFPLTQEYMAVMTGVQRTTVSTLANGFKERGLIRYSRGNIEILNEAGLEKASCECARVVRRQFEELEREAESSS